MSTMTSPTHDLALITLTKAQMHATLALAAATAAHRTSWTDENTTATCVEGDWTQVFG